MDYSIAQMNGNSIPYIQTRSGNFVLIYFVVYVEYLGKHIPSRNQY